MNPVEVTSRTDSSGSLLPVRFTWQGKEFPVLEIGRRWSDDDGEHVLVMVPGDRVFELIHRSENTWVLKPIPSQGKRWFA